MKIVVAVDSFKGCLESLEVGNALKAGILAVQPDAKVVVLPVADGGEGTAQTLASSLGGEMVDAQVCGPLGSPVMARYAVIGKTAIIEMSQAAGLPLVPNELRSPTNTTTRGVGELILNALDRGCTDFIVGIGGSATNDGGLGMMTALGVKFLGIKGNILKGFGRDVFTVHKIDVSGLDERIKSREPGKLISFTIACDVDNPMCGKNGCSYVFGPQKGLSDADIPYMDLALRQYANLSEEAMDRADLDISNMPGAGAAGGIGFAFVNFLHGKLCSGIETVLTAVKLEEHLADADLVITGEGRLDEQSFMGKAPAGVAKLASKNGIPTVAVCGTSLVSREECRKNGIDNFFEVTPKDMKLSAAMKPEIALENIRRTAVKILNAY